MGEVAERVNAREEGDKPAEARWERPRPVTAPAVVSRWCRHGFLPCRRIRQFHPFPQFPHRMDKERGPPDGDGQNGPAPAAPNLQQPAQAQPQPSPIAPTGRFLGARLNFGKFAGGGGDRRHMQRGLRDYVRKGYGGRATAVRRFGGTASTAGTLYGALSSVAGGQAAAPGSPLDPALLAGRSAREVMDAIVEAVRPADGTQDAEASRAAIKDALSELLTMFPEADLLNLTEDQRETAIERFVAIDVYRRAILDIGKAIQAKAPNCGSRPCASQRG